MLLRAVTRESVSQSLCCGRRHRTRWHSGGMWRERWKQTERFFDPQNTSSPCVNDSGSMGGDPNVEFKVLFFLTCFGCNWEESWVFFLLNVSIKATQSYTNFWFRADAAPMSLLAQDLDSEFEDSDIELDLESFCPDRSTAASPAHTPSQQHRFLLYSNTGVSDPDVKAFVISPQSFGTRRRLYSVADSLNWQDFSQWD